jgi:hypothetical protein
MQTELWKQTKHIIQNKQDNFLYAKDPNGLNLPPLWNS